MSTWKKATVNIDNYTTQIVYKQRIKMIKRVLNLLLIALVLVASNACSSKGEITVASYNVRYDNRGDAERGNAWENRHSIITGLIRFNDFEIFGTQEVLDHMLKDMLADLPDYSYIDVGRDDGKTKGEYAPIFYKTSRFELLNSGNFWLSEETEFPNKGWDAALPRICTRGEFKDKKSKLRFYFFNLHMDHVGVQARSESSKLVLRKIKEMCGNRPVILTGDFNVDQNNNNYQLLAESEILNDSFDIAKMRYALNGTFNAFDPNLKTESRIDHIFVTNDFTVEK
jgi:endonuclease/exonuclease/phosphatase family metal-dependent hydrolase